jgi:hypothetical protein
MITPIATLLELINKEPSSKYESSDLYFKDGSFLFLGFEIKSEYDEKRLTINASLSPKYIRHEIIIDGDKFAKYYYGIILKGNKLYDRLSHNLIISSTNKKFELNTEAYIRLCQEYNLCTDNSYRYYHPGIYPFDDIKSLYEKTINYSLFFANEYVLFYQGIASVQPYIFCKTNL